MSFGMCGRWRNGRLVDHCTMAGTEECDFECPHRDEPSDRERSRAIFDAKVRTHGYVDRVTGELSTIPPPLARKDRNMAEPTMNKWTPTTNLLELRRLGKLGEELGELGNVASRCIIQGLDEVDPGTGKVNRQRLLDELADVYAQIECTIEAFGLDRTYYAERVVRKVRQMGEWEALFLDAASGVDTSDGGQQ